MLIDEIAGTLETKKQAAAVVNSLLNTITAALAAGQTVNLKGLGSFKVVERSARKGINPRTGETIDITARKAVRFQPAQKLKQAVN